MNDTKIIEEFNQLLFDIKSYLLSNNNFVLFNFLSWCKIILDKDINSYLGAVGIDNNFKLHLILNFNLIHNNFNKPLKLKRILFILYHELLHYLLGHLYTSNHSLQNNIYTDALINYSIINSNLLFQTCNNVYYTPVGVILLTDSFLKSEKLKFKDLSFEKLKHICTNKIDQINGKFLEPPKMFDYVTDYFYENVIIENEKKQMFHVKNLNVLNKKIFCQKIEDVLFSQIIKKNDKKEKNISDIYDIKTFKTCSVNFSQFEKLGKQFKVTIKPSQLQNCVFVINNKKVDPNSSTQLISKINKNTLSENEYRKELEKHKNEILKYYNKEKELNKNNTNIGTNSLLKKWLIEKSIKPNVKIKIPVITQLLHSLPKQSPIKTWKKINRRYIHNNILERGYSRKKAGRIIFCIDSSGSYYEKENFERVNGYVKKLIKTNNIDLIFNDTKIVSHKNYTANKKFKFEAVGSGGTCFEKFFNEYVPENYKNIYKIIPIVLFTDLYFYWDKINPELVTNYLNIVVFDNEYDNSNKDYKKIKNVKLIIDRMR